MVWKIFKWILITFASLIVLLIVSAVAIPKIAPQFGGNVKGKHLERIKQSPNFRNDRFYNLVETKMNGENGSMWKAAWKFLKGGDNREPDDTLSTIQFSKENFISDTNAFHFTWFGHSTVLVKIGGKNLLIDPIFSNHASPFSFFGPQAFPYSYQYSLDDLPRLDAVIITHDHYDHLDYETFIELKDRVSLFFVPLGVSAHLIKWGVSEEQIIELDWWNESTFDKITLACVPMRHFSGRGMGDRYSTLWAGWVIKSGNHSIIHTGDSGYGDHFKEIGEKYGPFDLAMVECGQYNENWPNIHMMPEETVQASIDLNAKYLLPIHWGRFNLALHAWTDPIDRATLEAEIKNVNLISPVVGELVSLHPPIPTKHWWE